MRMETQPHDAAPLPVRPPRKAKVILYRVVEPRLRELPPFLAGIREPDRVNYVFWPPRVVLPYTQAEAVKVLAALCQRWLDNGRWPPTRLEPWADLLPRRMKAADISPLVRTDAAFTLRHHVEKRVGALAARRGYLLDEFLEGRLLGCGDWKIGNDEDNWCCHVLLSARRAPALPSPAGLPEEEEDEEETDPDHDPDCP